MKILIWVILNLNVDSPQSIATKTSLNLCQVMYKNSLLPFLSKYKTKIGCRIMGTKFITADS